MRRSGNPLVTYPAWFPQVGDHAFSATGGAFVFGVGCFAARRRWGALPWCVLRCVRILLGQ